MKTGKLPAACCLCLLLLAGCTLPGKEAPGKTLAAYQDMHNGIFIHYTYAGKPYEWGTTIWADGSEVASLDEPADNLDVNDLAEVAASARAQYVIFTTFHANMQALFPSKVMNQYLPGHISRRDAVGDLIGALKARGIRTVLYFHPSDIRSPCHPATGGTIWIRLSNLNKKACPDRFINNQPRPSQGRKTFNTRYYFRKDSPLQPAGLSGLVQIVRQTVKHN